ncbi:hypothetical protein SKAU_G00084480 [Synaphobranchus kaupii]|uniref:Uncharacterized protein n=1 Tax=Synaphobranchus kaupii TaxID=118154 RepID=A0A9Q1FVG7_SYNKA|nr:hypothetical protein SKAU_G00084480 [Synaphobranchus kaupii]
MWPREPLLLLCPDMSQLQEHLPQIYLLVNYGAALGGAVTPLFSEASRPRSVHREEVCARLRLNRETRR